MKKNVKKKYLKKDLDHAVDPNQSKMPQKRPAKSEIADSSDILPKTRHDPLHVSLAKAEGSLRPTTNNDREINEANEDIDDRYLDASESRKIIQLARDQQKEIYLEQRATTENFSLKEYRIDAQEREEIPIPEYSADTEIERENDYEEIEEYDTEDNRLFEKYAGNHEDDDQPTLADKIMEKIRAKEEMESSGQESQFQLEGESQGVMLPEKVIAVYTQVGELLSRYRSGKLPRAFKIIPTLQNWEDILYVTQPESWSSQAVYESTKMFISALSAQESQKFVHNVLLDRFKAELDPNAPRLPNSGPRTLNYHIFRALKKSLYKPAAFFKGFLFPLAESGSCSVREAVIASSIITQVSIPVLHSAAALMRLAEFEYYSSPISLFIRALLQKKYALPYKVVDSVVFHFMKFRTYKDTSIKEKQLPVVWHQSLLVFAQYYKNEITEDQRDALLEILKIQTHPTVIQEIRRELKSGIART